MELMPGLMEWRVTASTPEPPLPVSTIERLDMGNLSHGNSIGCREPSSASTSRSQRLGHHGLVPPRELVEQRKDDRMVLSPLALTQPRAAARAVAVAAIAARPRFPIVRRLAVDTHDAPSSGHALVQELLHHPTLIAPFR